jgi:hypothetical protein
MFEGKIISSKWAKQEKRPQHTSLRHIDDLIGRGILKTPAGTEHESAAGRELNDDR